MAPAFQSFLFVIHRRPQYVTRMSRLPPVFILRIITGVSFYGGKISRQSKITIKRNVWNLQAYVLSRTRNILTYNTHTHTHTYIYSLYICYIYTYAEKYASNI
jgi:hypothetical protein